MKKSEMPEILNATTFVYTFMIVKTTNTNIGVSLSISILWMLHKTSNSVMINYEFAIKEIF